MAVIDLANRGRIYEVTMTATAPQISACDWLTDINALRLIIYMHIVPWGTQWRSCLRHCATSRMVAGSIPDGVIEIFHWHNPSGRTMALRSTQPLTEIGTRNFLGVWRPVRRADNLTTFMCRVSWNLGASASWNPQGLFRCVMGLLYLYLTYYRLRVRVVKTWS
jgi:hypothetical protein